MNQVTALVDTIDDVGSPFMDTSKELLTIDTNIVMTTDAVESVKNERQTSISDIYITKYWK